MVGLFLPRREHASNIELFCEASCIEDFLDFIPSHIFVSTSPVKPLMDEVSYPSDESPDTMTTIGYRKVVYPSTHDRINFFKDLHVVGRIEVSPKKGFNLSKALIHTI